MPQPSSSSQEGDQQDSVLGFLLDTLLRETTLCLAVMDAGGTVTMMSPGLQTLLETEFVPLTVEGIIERFGTRVEDGSRRITVEEEPLNRTRLGETVRDEVYCLPLSDGRLLHLRCSGTPLRGEAGEIRGGILLFDDISAERAAVRAQDQLRDRLVATVSHELRTPLTTLLGHAELLEDLQADLPDQAMRSLRAVIASGERLRDLAQTVTDLVDLESTQHVALVSIDVSARIRQVVDEQVPAARRKRVELTVAVPDRFVAQVDGWQFAKSLAALLDNSVRHAPADSTVDVRLRTCGPHFSVEVVDSGPGIPQVERDRLVQPFERGDVQRIAPEGRGLGLALARTYAVANRGRFCLEDNVPTGLRVRIELPFVPGPDEVAAASGSVVSSGR